MNEIHVLAALSKYLDTLDSIVRWATFFALAAVLTGLQQRKSLSVLGVTVERSGAFIAASVAFVLANFAFAITFWRMVVLLKQTPDASSQAALTIVAFHHWLFNPLAYSGYDWPSLLVSSVGIGLLIAVWWLCFLSLFALRHNTTRKDLFVVLGCLLILGLLSIAAIIFGQNAMLEKATANSSNFWFAIDVSNKLKVISALLGIAVGALISRVLPKLRSRLVLGDV